MFRGGLVHEMVGVREGRECQWAECVWRLGASLAGLPHRPGVLAAAPRGPWATEDQQTGFPLGLLGGARPSRSRTAHHARRGFALAFAFSHYCHLQLPPSLIFLKDIIF